MLKRTLLVLLVVALLAVFAVAPAAAQTPEHCGDPDLPGQSGYGQHHAEMARAGHLGAEMNPGHHRGASTCLP